MRTLNLAVCGIRSAETLEVRALRLRACSARTLKATPSGRDNTFACFDGPELSRAGEHVGLMYTRVRRARRHTAKAGPYDGSKRWHE